MTYRLPSLKTLRAFEAAARHLSFKTAADELGVTPGAISQQVRKLEISLGVELFRRLPRGLLLTEPGETYLSRLTRIFEDLSDATEAISPTINGKKFSVGLAPEVRRLLRADWPGCDADLAHFVRDVRRTSDIELLRANRIDCLIRLGGGPFGDLSLTKIPTGSQGGIAFLCKPGLAQCRQAQVILASLRQHIAA